MFRLKDKVVVRFGRESSDNPWEATSLEWVTASPPPHNNFGEEQPRVYRGAYEYSIPGETRDYCMQSEAGEALRK